MMEKDNIKARIEELRKKDIAKVEWTRQRDLNEINYALDMNKKDMERIAEAYNSNNIAMLNITYIMKKYIR